MARWKVLPVSRRTHGVPSLLVKHDIQDSSYTIMVTDLTNIWTETMDKKAIIRRWSSQDDTSVDPTDGPDQLKKFLECIRDAVDGKANTATNITTESNEGTLVINLIAHLPPPLGPFLWFLNASIEPREVLTTQFVLPVLDSLIHEKQAVSSLLRATRERDDAINRLLDKLESSNVDISTIFPSAALGRGFGQLSRQALQNSMPSLNTFDEYQWRQSLRQPSSYFSQQDICKKIFPNNPSDEPCLERESAGTWWTTIREAPDVSDSVVFDSQPTMTAKTVNRTSDDKLQVG